MSLNVLRSYILICNRRGLEPTWEGLKNYENSINYK